MPRRYAMSTLRTRCQQRCDLENSGHIATAEWNALISEQYGDLFSTVAETGLRYFETESTITTTGAASYDEPADHYGGVGIDRIVDPVSGRRYQLQEIMAQERARWSGMTGDASVFALVDDQIYLYPRPPSGQTYKVLYIPQPPDLTSYADGDIIDIVTPDGEAFLTWGVAVKALAKSESDPSLALAEREAARGRLTEWAQLRGFNSPRRVVTDDDMFAYRSYQQGDWRY